MFCGRSKPLPYTEGDLLRGIDVGERLGAPDRKSRLISEKAEALHFYLRLDIISPSVILRTTDGRPYDRCANVADGDTVRRKRRTLQIKVDLLCGGRHLAERSRDDEHACRRRSLRINHTM